jgi:hypothetical protein
MHNAAVAESILPLATPRERAAAIVGDLLGETAC